MLLPTIFLLLVGTVFADTQNGWKDGKEYTYKIRSRTFAAINPHLKQYTGIFMKAYLTIQPNGPETLRAKISEPHYSSIYTRLENGWDSEVSENQTNFKKYPFTDQPFEIKMKNGIIKELILNKDIPTWEVNVLKSIVSQLQVDAQGENAQISEYNQFPENDQPNALFKTMEDSVTGLCEVLYDISPLPEHVLQVKPELAPMPELQENGDMISIVKTKNYSNCDQRISYHHGFNGRNNWKPGSNNNGKYLSRSSVSRIIISGNLWMYTIQSSVTTNKVVLNPDQKGNRQGMVVSRMNLTLHDIKDISEQISIPPDSQSTGNLVYNYNSPFQRELSRRPNIFKTNGKSKFDKYNSSSEELNWYRKKYNGKGNSDEYDSSDPSDSTYDNNDDSYLQQKPKLLEAPQNPMLPYFIGNHGDSIQDNENMDVEKSVKNISQQISNEMQNPDRMLTEQTLDKFTILIRLIRTMNDEQIANVHRVLYEESISDNQSNQNNQDQNARKNIWVVFRDAVAQAGTGPALVNIKKWIENSQIQGYEAATIISAIADSTQVPTTEYIEAFFEMVTMHVTKRQPVVRDTAIISFSDLLRHAVVNKKSSHNRYPVHVFGRFHSQNYHNLMKKYIPYIADELQTAVNNGDSNKIQVYSIALGRTAHPRILSILEPYLEGMKPVSPYQRLIMVLSLCKIASIYPKRAQSIFYKMYSNNADYHEIRTAAVFLLMKTNPSTSMMQRMAEYTNYDTNKHVNSAVKSAIESLAQLQGYETRELSSAAKAALPLLTSEIYGPQYSKSFINNFENHQIHSEFSLTTNYIGSIDSIIPKAVFITIQSKYNGLKAPEIKFGGIFASIQNIWNFVQQKFNNYQQSRTSNVNAQQKKYSPENVAKLLGIHGEEPEQIEGLLFMHAINNNHFLPFDNHSLEQIPELLGEWNKIMIKGSNFQHTKLSNSEVTLSFPTDTGYPLTFSLKTPEIFNVKGQCQSKSDFDTDNHFTIPKSANISGKTSLVYGMRIQKRLGFVVPFEHQEYMGGIDRNIQIYLPIRSEIEYDKYKKEARMKFQPDGMKNEYTIFEYTTNPFISKHDILSLKPVSKNKNTHVVHKNYTEKTKQRLQFNWENKKTRPSKGNEYLSNKIEKSMDGASDLTYSIASFYLPNYPDRTEYEKYYIKIFPDNNTNIEIKFSYNSSFVESNDNTYSSDYWTPNVTVPHLAKELNQRERQQKISEEASKNISSVQTKVFDISVHLNDDTQSSLTMTAALGKSNVDEKSRILFYANAKNNDKEDYYLSAGIESKIPNVQTLDYQETLKANTRREYDAKIDYGVNNDEDGEKNLSKVKIQGKIEQTNELKNQIRESESARICKEQENQHGNKIILACENINKRAASIDTGNFTITFENEKLLQEITMDTLDLVESMSLNLAEISKSRFNKGEEDKIKIAFEVLPEDGQIDVSVKTSEGKIRFNNIQWNDKNKEYSTNNKDSNYEENPFNLSFDDVCYLDKTQVKTFDNHHYRLELGQCWHVVMTSYPKNDPDRPGRVQEISENMHVSILTREDKDGYKEMKITLGDSEIELLPPKALKVDVKVDGQNVEYSIGKNYKKMQNDEVVFELFELFDKSVKLVSDKYNIRIVYDGHRAQVEVGERYRDSVRGLCGNNDGESDNDQKVPKGCYLRKSEEFVATYALINDDQCMGPALDNAEKAKKAWCSFDLSRSGNIISHNTNRNNSQQQSFDTHRIRCTKHRTNVMKFENEICFSLRPLPVCISNCRPMALKPKNIQYYCVARTTASEKVAERVELGANPDLSQKKVSRTEIFDIPINCRP